MSVRTPTKAAFAGVAGMGRAHTLRDFLGTATKDTGQKVKGTAKVTLALGMDSTHTMANGARAS